MSHWRECELSRVPAILQMADKGQTLVCMGECNLPTQMRNRQAKKRYINGRQLMDRNWNKMKWTVKVNDGNQLWESNIFMMTFANPLGSPQKMIYICFIYCLKALVEGLLLWQLHLYNLLNIFHLRTDATLWFINTRHAWCICDYCGFLIVHGDPCSGDVDLWLFGYPFVFYRTYCSINVFEIFEKWHIIAVKAYGCEWKIISWNMARL